MGKRQKSGQAAMEFLMTYGWAILVVLIAIAALAYYGVLSPSTFLPAHCIMPAPFSCVGFKASLSGSDVLFQMTISNGGYGAAQVSTVSVDDTTLQNLLGTCTASPAVTLNPGQQQPFQVTCSGMAKNFPNGGRMKTVIALTYKDMQTGYTHTVNGEIVGDVEKT